MAYIFQFFSHDTPLHQLFNCYVQVQKFSCSYVV